MTEAPIDIDKELLFVEDAIAFPKNYNPDAISQKIDEMYEGIINQSELDKGTFQEYLPEFLVWRNKMKEVSKMQSNIFDELHQIIKEVIKNSERVLKRKAALTNDENSNERLLVLKRELELSFDKMKSHIPEGARLQYKKDLISLHSKRRLTYFKSTFLKNIISFIVTLIIFILSFYIATIFEWLINSSSKTPLLTPQRIFVSACIYFGFDKLLQKFETRIKWSIITKSFKRVKEFKNLIYYKDKEIVERYNDQMKKLEDEKIRMQSLLTQI